MDKYSFTEGNLSKDFCTDRVTEIRKLVTQGDSFCIHVIPGTGLSQFLRFLVCQELAKFVYVDVFAQSELTRSSLFQLLLSELGGSPKKKSDQQILQECKKLLISLSKESKIKKVAIVINRFDHLRKEFDLALFSNLQFLKDCSPNVVIICTSVRPIADLAPATLDAASLTLFAKSVFFTPYANQDLRSLYQALHSNEDLPENFLEQIHRSGGNYQLLELLIKSDYKNSPLLDPFIRMQFQRIKSFLIPDELKVIEKVANNKDVSNIPNYLTSVGLVKKHNQKLRLFSSLFQDFIASQKSPHLADKEKRLLQILQKNIGQVVSKEDILNFVWGENSLEASDWALNSLIYRLRNSSLFKNSGYSIESHKKLGYKLYLG